jgi:hypothetical protein
MLKIMNGIVDNSVDLQSCFELKYSQWAYGADNPSKDGFGEGFPVRGLGHICQCPQV